MPNHTFICRDDDMVVDIWRSIHEESPDHPPCPVCGERMSKQFTNQLHFNTQIEVRSAGVGYHASERKYRSALSEYSDQHSERVGMEVKYEAFDPRDTDGIQAEPEDDE